MKASATLNNLHIEDSYKCPKVYMKYLLEHYDDDFPECMVFVWRSMDSMINEWCVHNLLYKLGIARSHTASVDINYPLKWYESITYAILGPIAKLLLK